MDWVRPFILFIPAMSIPVGRFTKKQGLPLGIAAGGGALGGAVMAEVTVALITKVGMVWTLRIEGFIFLAILATCLATVKPFDDGSNITAKPKIWDNSLFKIPAHSTLVLSAFLYEWMFLVPFYFTGNYAETIALGAQIASNAVAIVAVFNGFGRFCMGVLADYIGISIHSFCVTFCVGASSSSFGPLPKQLALSMLFVLYKDCLPVLTGL
jgi:nitrate/nitrite transporter NarK